MVHLLEKPLLLDLKAVGFHKPTGAYRSPNDL